MNAIDIHIPCSPGDEVYIYDYERLGAEPVKTKIKSVSVLTKNIVWLFTHMDYAFTADELGKSVFDTYEKALARKED